MKSGVLILLILLLVFAFLESRPSEETSMQPTAIRLPNPNLPTN